MVAKIYFKKTREVFNFILFSSLVIYFGWVLHYQTIEIWKILDNKECAIAQVIEVDDEDSRYHDCRYKFIANGKVYEGRESPVSHKALWKYYLVIYEKGNPSNNYLCLSSQYIRINKKGSSW